MKLSLKEDNLRNEARVEASESRGTSKRTFFKVIHEWFVSPVETEFDNNDKGSKEQEIVEQKIDFKKSIKNIK